MISSLMIRDHEISLVFFILAQFHLQMPLFLWDSRLILVLRYFLKEMPFTGLGIALLARVAIEIIYVGKLKYNCNIKLL